MTPAAGDTVTEVVWEPVSQPLIATCVLLIVTYH